MNLKNFNLESVPCLIICTKNLNCIAEIFDVDLPQSKTLFNYFKLYFDQTSLHWTPAGHTFPDPRFVKSVQQFTSPLCFTCVAKKAKESFRTMFTRQTANVNVAPAAVQFVVQCCIAMTLICKVDSPLRLSNLLDFAFPKICPLF